MYSCCGSERKRKSWGSSFGIPVCRTLSNTDTQGAPKGNRATQGTQAEKLRSIGKPPSNSAVYTLKEGD